MLPYRSYKKINFCDAPVVNNFVAVISTKYTLYIISLIFLINFISYSLINFPFFSPSIFTNIIRTRNYKILGESMRKLGGIAAAGLIGLEHKVPRLIEDHKRALIIAKAINLLNSEIFHVDLETVHTNVVVVTVTIIGSISAETLYKRLRIVNDSNEDDKVIIKSVFNTTKNLLRMDLHCDIDDSMMIAAIRKLRHVMKQLESQAFAQFVCTNCAQNNTIKK